MRLRLRLSVGITLGLGMVPRAADAAPVVYTSYAAFLAALGGSFAVANFDSTLSGAVIASGGASQGITFSYAFGGASLIVTDGTEGDGGGPFDTTTPFNFLGTDDFDTLVDGDSLVLGFPAARAIGLSIITAEEPGDTLRDGDIGLTANGGIALIDVEAVQQTLPDGSLVYFVGVTDPQTSFASAGLETSGGGEAFAYTIDRIVRMNSSAPPVPLPGTLLMGVMISFVIAALWQQRKRGAR